MTRPTTENRLAQGAVGVRIIMGLLEEITELTAKLDQLKAETRAHMKKYERIYHKYHNHSWKRRGAQERANMRWRAEHALAYLALEQRQAIWEGVGELIKDYDEFAEAEDIRLGWEKARDEMEWDLKVTKHLGKVWMAAADNKPLPPPPNLS